MLRLRKNREETTLFAGGKHPSFRDFINYGTETSMSRALSQWIDRGHTEFTSRFGTAYQGVSWRFWSRGNDWDTIAWGVLKASSDSIGRCYPLLILAQDRISNRNDIWDRLPTGLDEGWKRMEQLTAMRFTTAQMFQDELARLSRSVLKWKESLWKEPDDKSGRITPELEEYMNTAWTALKSEELTVLTLPLKEIPPGPEELFDPVAAWHLYFRSRWPEPPLASFAGGMATEPRLVFFKRPLAHKDFTTLWSISTDNKD